VDEQGTQACGVAKDLQDTRDWYRGRRGRDFGFRFRIANPLDGHALALSPGRVRVKVSKFKTHCGTQACGVAKDLQANKF
jgi:hypothetical protein